MEGLFFFCITKSISLFCSKSVSHKNLFGFHLTQDVNKSGKNFQLRKIRFFSLLVHKNLIQSATIIVLIWQIREIFDFGPFEGPYVLESQRSWHPELNVKLNILKYLVTSIYIITKSISLDVIYGVLSQSHPLWQLATGRYHLKLFLNFYPHLILSHWWINSRKNLLLYVPGGTNIIYHNSFFIIFSHEFRCGDITLQGIPIWAWLMKSVDWNWFVFFPIMKPLGSTCTDMWKFLST